MQNTNNMGLVIWDQPQTDKFSHTDYDNNLTKIDQHDHTTGKGVQIPTAGIAPQAIDNTRLAPNAVQQANIAPGAVGTTQIAAGAVTADKLAVGDLDFANITPGSVDPNFMPLGTIMMWWRPSGSSLLPGGDWEICDGRPWANVANAWGLTTGNMPDLRNRFPLGADINGSVAPVIGATGGSNTINVSHHHTVNPHHHHTPPHQHGIGPDGGHYHTLLSGYHLAMRQNCFPVGITVKDTSNVNQNNNKYSLYIQGYNSATTDFQTDMDVVGDHNHGGQTSASDPTLATDDQSPTTDTQLGSVTVVPAYLSLLFIMRVRSA
jgi:hypothetical protein